VRLIYRTFFCVILFFIAAVIWFGGQTMVANGQWGLTILATAQHKIHHTWFEAFNLGILCNIMVCVAVWMSYSGKTVTDKAFIMIMPIGLFVASGFEHCVANMFMIPLGIITAHSSTPTNHISNSRKKITYEVCPSNHFPKDDLFIFYDLFPFNIRRSGNNHFVSFNSC
jgi:formate/nitrite transporter